VRVFGEKKKGKKGELLLSSLTLSNFRGEGIPITNYVRFEKRKKKKKGEEGEAGGRECSPINGISEREKKGFSNRNRYVNLKSWGNREEQ